MSLLKKLWDCFTSPSETVKILTESEPALADQEISYGSQIVVVFLPAKELL